jgi:hypothetical protein
MAKQRTGKRIFSYDEALNTFPLVRDLTSAAVRQIEALATSLGGREDVDAEARGDVLAEAQEKIVRAWTREVTALGCEVKGIWLVDWDTGDGYYCWRFPEQAISFFHTYDEGFAGRIPIN